MDLTKKQIMEAMKTYKYLKQQLICLNNADSHSINLVAQKLSDTRLRFAKEERELNKQNLEINNEKELLDKQNGFLDIRYGSVEFTIMQYEYGLYYIDISSGIRVYRNNHFLGTLGKDDIELLEQWI